MTHLHCTQPARAPHRAALTAALAAVLALCLAIAGCATAGDPQAALAPQPVLVASPVALPAAAPPAAAGNDSAITIGPLQPRFRLDPLQDAERGDLWQRVRAGFAMADVDNELVRKWEQWYARDPAYVQRMTERGGRYLFYIVEELQRRQMPTELALLPFTESAFNPQAQSHARASGMWQFMPATGKDFELRQNLFRDDRRNVLASTRAALDYLQRLYAQFGDWQLALAAYNWGQGNVQKALDRNRQGGLPASYDSIRMPQETREYVPKLQAVKNIVLRPQAFGLQLPVLGDHPFFLSVAIERDIDVDVAARLAGLSLDAFQQLNPQMNKPVILAAGTPQVLLPYDNANRFLRELALHRGALASWTAWVAPRTVKVAEAAQLTGMDEAQLRDVNRIPPRMLVKAGSTLLVPRLAHATADVQIHIADNADLSLAPETPPLRRLAFKAGRQGDSVVAVARRYRVSTAQVAQWNGVAPQGRFKAGQAIVVLVPAVAATTRTASAAAAAAPLRAAQPQPQSQSQSGRQARAAAHAVPAARVAKAAVAARKHRAAVAAAVPAPRLAQGPSQAAPR